MGCACQLVIKKMMMMMTFGKQAGTEACLSVYITKLQCVLTYIFKCCIQILSLTCWYI